MRKEHRRIGNGHHAMSEKMKNGEGLIHAYLLDGTGGGRRLEIADIKSWTPKEGVLWVHFN